MFKKIAYVLLILISIQLMNQFLIFSGSALEIWLSGIPNSRIIVGVYQQIVQAAIGIILYRWIFKKGVKGLGINTNNGNISMNYFYYFVAIWSFIVFLYCSVTYCHFPDTWAMMTSIELPPLNTMIATLLFQSFFPGCGEEILFRGLIINLLTFLVFTRYRNNKAGRIGVIVLSSMYFAIAHVYFTIAPFRITHVDYLQLGMAIGCGIFYAIAFLKTRSLLAPFLAHNFSNTTSTLCGYVIASM